MQSIIWVFSSEQFQSYNKSLINQACSGPSWENIGPWSFLYGPRCARSILSRPRADILPVRPSCLVNKIYVSSKCRAYHILTFDSQLIPSTFTLSDPNLGGGFYFYYSLLSNDVTNEVFQDLLQPNFPAERASVRISSNLEVLKAFFAQHPGLEVKIE